MRYELREKKIIKFKKTMYTFAFKNKNWFSNKKRVSFNREK